MSCEQHGIERHHPLHRAPARRPFEARFPPSLSSGTGYPGARAGRRVGKLSAVEMNRAQGTHSVVASRRWMPCPPVISVAKHSVVERAEDKTIFFDQPAGSPTFSSSSPEVHLAKPNRD